VIGRFAGCANATKDIAREKTAPVRTRTQLAEFIGMTSEPECGRKVDRNGWQRPRQQLPGEMQSVTVGQIGKQNSRANILLEMIV
jgi:hypothetical protein